LDGNFEDIYECWRRGSVVVVHAHGDNIERLRQHLPLLRERVEATCQCAPRGHIHNFGGFTDGDRAIFMAAALGAKKIVTIGMCLTCGVGKYSAALKAANPDWLAVKKMKLDYAHQLLTWLAETRRDIEFIDATQAEWSLPQGFKKKTLKEVLSTIEL
ncbi:MAG: 6-hydroxymethylpterin diphosphokinase MptE-like protein, partial [Nitrososphaerota archaeon]